MNKRFGTGIRTALLTAAAAVIMAGAGLGSESGDVLPQVLLKGEWDWYSTNAPDYKELFKGQYELAYLDQESAAAYPELDRALREWSANEQAQEEEYCRDMHELADSVLESGYSTLPLNVENYLYVRRADEKVLSLLAFSSSYEGGAHGMYGYGGYNFDSRTGEKIGLEDVFSSTEALPERIASILRETYPDTQFFDLEGTLAGDYADGYWKEWSWTLDPNGVTFYFAPYYLASYADGHLEAFIPFEGNEGFFTGNYGEQTGAWAMEMPDYFNQNYMSADGSRHTLALMRSQDEYGAYTSLAIEKDGVQTTVSDIWYYDADFSLVHMADGNYYLYAQLTSENDYSTIYVYDLSGTPYQIAAIDGSYASASEGPEDVEDGVWDCVLSHPERFAVSTVIQYLSTCFGTRDYAPGADGKPEALTSWYEFDYARTITAKMDLSMQGVEYPEESPEGKETGAVTVKSGEDLTFYRTDGETYMDLKRADGTVVRCRLGNSQGWPYTIDGVDIAEAFDGIMFAG